MSVTVQYARADARDAIQAVVDAAALPPCRLVVAAAEGNLDREHFVGEATTRALARLKHSGTFTGRMDDPNWDAGIALSSVATALAATHPAYFAAVVAHELAHAYMALDDIQAHVYGLFVQNYHSAITGKEHWNHHRLPHERIANEFALHVTIPRWGRHRLNDECVDVGATSGHPCESHASALMHFDVARRIDALRGDLMVYAQPFAARLISEWDRVHTSQADDRRRSLTQYATHIRTLFDGAR